MQSSKVTDAMVDAACWARLSAMTGESITYAEYQALRSEVECKWMRAALEAVLP